MLNEELLEMAKRLNAELQDKSEQVRINRIKRALMRVWQYGFVEGKTTYIQMMSQGDIVTLLSQIRDELAKLSKYISSREGL